MTFPSCIGKKVGMTQIFSEEGSAIPVTVIELFALTVTQIKTEQTDGYTAIQVGFDAVPERKLTKGRKGHLDKGSLPYFRHLKEFRISPEAIGDFSIGQVMTLEGEGFPFKESDKIGVTGRSIGKGFQGGTKRWGFSRGPMSHGSKSHRIPGSIGAGTTPGRVLKGKHMAGHMGDEQITKTGVEVVKLIPEKSLMLVKGGVAGVEGGVLTCSPIRKPVASV